MRNGISNALTIDVEEYFHSFRPLGFCPPETWATFPSRIEMQTHRLLDVLDSHSCKATFFVLGAVAEQHGDLVREIASRGHEVGTHGYGHEPIYWQTREAFREDITRAKGIIEDHIAEPVLGYRAPSFSIIPATAWAWEVLASLGFSYDNSVFPIRGHDLYGFADASRTPWIGPEGLLEIPMTTVRLMGKNLPIGGGGYLRIYPYGLTKLGLRSVNNSGNRAIVYIHPWEFDSDQPRIPVPLKTSIRHYMGIKANEQKLVRLLTDFKFGPINEVFKSDLDDPKSPPRMKR